LFRLIQQLLHYCNFLSLKSPIKERFQCSSRHLNQSKLMLHQNPKFSFILPISILLLCKKTSQWTEIIPSLLYPKLTLNTFFRCLILLLLSENQAQPWGHYFQQISCRNTLLLKNSCQLACRQQQLSLEH